MANSQAPAELKNCKLENSSHNVLEATNDAFWVTNSCKQ